VLDVSTSGYYDYCKLLKENNMLCSMSRKVSVMIMRLPKVSLVH
jgi:hypothetical protein